MTAQSDDDDYEYDEVDNDYEYGEDWDGWVLICSDSENDYCCKNGAKRGPLKVYHYDDPPWPSRPKDGLSLVMMMMVVI